jgi:hypothetical protein
MASPDATSTFRIQLEAQESSMWNRLAVVILATGDQTKTSSATHHLHEHKLKL